MALFNLLNLPLIILFNLSSGMKIYVKPEGAIYEIRIYCGKNREKLVLKFEQSGVQNIVKKWDAKFLQIERKDLELANCNEEAQEVVIDALSPNKIQMTVRTTVGQMSNEQTLVMGIPEHVFTTKNFTIIKQPKPAEKVTVESKNTEEGLSNSEMNEEIGQFSASTSSGFSRMHEFLTIGMPSPSDAKEWPQLVVYCWKQNIDSVTTHQREERSESRVVLGASWGQDNRVFIYRNENGGSELEGCTRDGVVLDWGKMRILMPQNRFLEVDELVASSSEELRSDQLAKTIFTFDNKLNSWDHDLVYRVLVYCYKMGTERKAMLLFGFGNQSIFNSYKATVSMVPDHQIIMETHCEGGKFLVDVWRWNIVYGTFEFAELKNEEHLLVEKQWKSKSKN